MFYLHIDDKLVKIAIRRKNYLFPILSSNTYFQLHFSICNYLCLLYIVWFSWWKFIFQIIQNLSFLWPFSVLHLRYATNKFIIFSVLWINRRINIFSEYIFSKCYYWVKDIYLSLFKFYVKKECICDLCLKQSFVVYISNIWHISIFFMQCLIQYLQYLISYLHRKLAKFS